MGRRLWGLSAGQTVALFAGALLVGGVVALVLGPSRGDDGRRPSATPARVRTGDRGSPAAVWVFGFETLRFPPDLGRAGQVPVQAYGDPLGTVGGVELFDAGTGRLGFLDARRNELRAVATLAPGTNPDSAFVPMVAVSGTTSWVASDPGVVVRVDGADGSRAVSATVAGSGARMTGVVASAGEAIAATETPTGVELARVGPDAGVVATGRIDGATLDGLAVDGSGIWVRSGPRLLRVDPRTLAVVRTAMVPSRGGIGGLAATAGDLWMLGDAGATLLRYDVARDRFDRPVRLLGRSPDAVELPAALVADGRRVVAMVQRRGARDLDARVVVYEPARDRTRAVDIPGRLAPGAIASSTR